QIILWGRTEKCLKETTEEIRMMGTECHYFICDVGNREEVYRQAKAVREKVIVTSHLLFLQVGDITILVNNAAVVHGKSLMDSDDDALLKSQHINTLGQFWVREVLVSHVFRIGNESDRLQPVNACLLLDCPGVNATTVLPFHTSTEMFQGMRIRFPNLFPPLKPETVARRTVEAVQMNQAFLLLPWTMHVLVI
ncbi:DHRS3 reductase, partial [Balaeniceps rex]|nr:DHRS3 reductase [Balaeniceps rex]